MLQILELFGGIGSLCVTDKTLLMTEKGFEKITNLTTADKILNYENRYTKVSGVVSQGMKEVWEIKSMADYRIKTTENHKFYSKKMFRVWNNEKRAYERKFENAKWIPVDELTREHYLSIPINNESKLPDWNGAIYTRGKTKYVKKTLDFSNDKFWYFCGRFLGDGWVNKRKDRNDGWSRTIICCPKNGDEDFEKKIEGLFHYVKVEERTVYKYQFSNKELTEFLALFKQGAKNKELPGFIFDLPVGHLKHFLHGYFDSDGSYKDGYQKASSISKKLIYGIGQCVAKVYHRPYAIYKSVRPKTHLIEGRLVNQNDVYQITFKKQTGKQDKAFYEDGKIWFPVREVHNTGSEEEFYSVDVEGGFTCLEGTQSN